MIVDPWGVVLAQAPDSETFITAELDLERQARDPPDAALARQPPPGCLPLAAGGTRLMATARSRSTSGG